MRKKNFHWQIIYYLCAEERLPMRLWKHTSYTEVRRAGSSTYGDNKLIHSAFRR